MFVEFKHAWGRHGIGDIADIEHTLSRRLVGMGIVEYKTELGKKTTPEFKVEPKPEPKEEPKEEPEKEVEEPVKVKKKPKRKYTKPEKAVKIEK